MKIPSLKIAIPSDPSFWMALALDAQRVIRTRTGQGLDHKDRSFKPYKASTLKDRTDRGRTSYVNLTDRGDMLGGMTSSGMATKGKVAFSGREGVKAYYNEKLGRVFFALSEEQQKGILTRVADWVIKKNKGIQL